MSRATRRAGSRREQYRKFYDYAGDVVRMYAKGYSVEQIAKATRSSEALVVRTLKFAARALEKQGIGEQAALEEEPNDQGGGGGG